MKSTGGLHPSSRLLDCVIINLIYIFQVINKSRYFYKIFITTKILYKYKFILNIVNNYIP
jgi:hypothetical protein